MLLFAASATTFAETGTMERFGSKMKYTFSGGVVTSKSKATISGTLRDDMTVLIKGEVKTLEQEKFVCFSGGGGGTTVSGNPDN